MQYLRLGFQYSVFPKTSYFTKEEGGLARFSCTTMRGQNMATFQAYCMKCKNTVTVKSPRKIVMSNGRTRVSGLCSRENCDGKLSKIIS